MTPVVEPFRSFAAVLRSGGSVRAYGASEPGGSAPRVEPPTPPPIMPQNVAAPPAPPESRQVAMLLASFASEIVRLRARAAELAEAEAESLLQLIASQVLVREFELAPVDVRALVERVRAEWETEHDVRFRVAPQDVERLRDLGERLEPDPALQPGDLQVVFANGLVDLRLGTRLAAILESHRVDL